MSNFRTIHKKEPKIMELNDVRPRKLKQSICIPSASDSYSMAISYMKQWFLEKFSDNYFNSIHIDGKHIFDDTSNLSKTQLIKRPLPALTITPSVDWTFNNDNVDSHPFGLSLYSALGKYSDSFFKDPIMNSYLGLKLELIFMQFSFKVRVESRAQQIDLFNHMKTACRIGFTDGRDVDMDFNIPYDIMLQLAEDTGFEVVYEDNRNPRVKEISKFLSYLNMHSSIPFLYKHRNINGNNEFYLRMNNIYIHVRPTDLSPDDGEREGHLSNNFNIDMTCEVRFPAPKFYGYYSTKNHRIKTVYSARNSIANFNPNDIHKFKGVDIPEVNNKGWNLYLTTSYEDEECYKNKSILEIDFNELFEGDINYTISECINSFVSPSIFIDIILINDAKIIPYTIDWEKKVLTTDEPVFNRASFIGIYCDTEFMHNTLETSKESYKNRITESK